MRKIKRLRISRPSPGTTLALIALVVATAGVATAAIPDSSGVISSCVGGATGTVRVIDVEAGEACRSNERSLTWNQTGEQGEPGPPGTGGVVKHVTSPSVFHVSAANAPAFQLVDLGGPEITVDVPAGGLVELLLRADFDGDGICSTGVVLRDAALPLQWGRHFQLVVSRHVRNHVREDNVYSAALPTSPNESPPGMYGQAHLGAWAVHSPSPGTHTYKIYFVQQPQSTGCYVDISDINIWAAVKPSM